MSTSLKGKTNKLAMLCKTQMDMKRTQSTYSRNSLEVAI